MDNTVVIVSGVSPNDRAGESEVFSEVDSCESSCDFNLWDNWTNNLETGNTKCYGNRCMENSASLFRHHIQVYIQVGDLLTWKTLNEVTKQCKLLLYE